MGGLEAADIGDYAAEDLTEFDDLIVGCPTWNTDADEYRSGTAWDDIIDDIKGSDLSGKTVAVFGCGDQEGYGDKFLGCPFDEDNQSDMSADRASAWVQQLKSEG